MKRLKSLLQSRWLFIFIVLVSLLYAFFILKNEIFKTHYHGNETVIIGYIKNIKIDGNHVKMVVRAEENVIVNYYAKKEVELIMIKNNYQVGDYIKIFGTLERPKPNTVFNLFNYQKYLLSQKIYWIVNSEKIEKLEIKPKSFYLLKRNIIKRIDGIEKSSAYIKNYIIAESSDIERAIYDSYQNNGLNHLLTLSGAQLSLFAHIILFIMNKINKSKTFNYLITIFILLFYVWLADAPPSLLRAFLMFLFLRINEILKLKINTLNIFILVFSLLILYNPYYFYHLGFLFSLSISFYLILFSDVINNYNNYFAKSFIISVIAFFVSIPILINNFFEINLLISLINLIFVPIFSFIIFPLSIIVFMFPSFDYLLYLIIKLTETLSLKISQIDIFVITLKHMSIIGVIIYYLIITYVIWALRNKKYRCFIYLLMLLFIHFVSPSFNRYPVITFIDVGQGDSILIELPQGRGNILIDTGGITSFVKEEWMKKQNEYSLAKSRIIPYLKSRGIRKLDYLILTHGDTDHMGEAVNLVENFKVKNVIFNVGEYNTLENELIEILDIKNIKYYQGLKELSIRKYKLQFLNTGEYDNENDNSNVIYMKINNYNFLFMGDASTIREKDILKEYNLINIDFLKVGHHGSNTSSSNDFINTINPKYSIISVGANNRYGHPQDSVLKILSKSIIYRTDKDGSIKIKINKNGYKIWTCIV